MLPKHRLRGSWGWIFRGSLLPSHPCIYQSEKRKETVYSLGTGEISQGCPCPARAPGLPTPIGFNPRFNPSLWGNISMADWGMVHCNTQLREQSVKCPGWVVSASLKFVYTAPHLREHAPRASFRVCGGLNKRGA